MNKSLLTNGLSLLVVVTGFFVPESWRSIVLNTGLFALSGGVTNWIAIHMLFERVPGLYGSGVIPAHFKEFKLGIKGLIMEQFFNAENISSFFKKSAESPDGPKHEGLGKIIESVDLNKAFDSLIEVILASSFGSMLSMVGGKGALDGLRAPFIEKMQAFLHEAAQDKAILEHLSHTTAETLLLKIEPIVESRLEELTPQMVKDIVQGMIRQHLGWLVVWGGIFGGLIGLLSSLIFLS